MSISFSYVAVTADAKSVEDALFALCPEFYIMDRQPQLDTFVQMYGYCQSRSGYLNGLHPNDVKAFCAHQGWCIIVDFSLVLPEENHVLAALSTQFGKVVTAVTHGTSGTVFFCLFEDGKMKRRILSSKGTVQAQGEPLEEEAGTESDVFTVTALDRLWQAQGLPPYLSRLPGPYSAVHYLDNTEASVAKDIEEIAERTRQYEEVEAMRRSQTKMQVFPAELLPAAAANDTSNTINETEEPSPAATEEPAPVATEEPAPSAMEHPAPARDLETKDATRSDNQPADQSASDDANGFDEDDYDEAEKPKDKPWWKLW